MIQEDCYDENLSLIQEKIEDGKMRFLEGTLSFNAGFSSILTVKNYEERLKNETPRYFLGNLLTLSQEICIIKPESNLFGKTSFSVLLLIFSQDLLEGFI